MFLVPVPVAAVSLFILLLPVHLSGPKDTERGTGKGEEYDSGRYVPIPPLYRSVCFAVSVGFLSLARSFYAPLLYSPLYGPNTNTNNHNSVGAVVVGICIMGRKRLTNHDFGFTARCLSYCRAGKPKT